MLPTSASSLKWEEIRGKLKSTVLNEHLEYVYNTWYAKWDIIPQANLLLSYLEADTLAEVTLEHLTKLRNKAEVAHYGLWSKGKIRKEELKKHKKMSEETKIALKELSAAKKESAKSQKAERTKRLTVLNEELAKSGLTGRLPTYADLAKQAEIVAKYPWVVAGSFKPADADDKKTVISIKCIKCGSLRVVHSSEAFHVKRCKKCKNSQ
jgi:hypothetical protein